MKLDECLPALPKLPTLYVMPGEEYAWRKWTRAYGLACGRAGALAALDEAFNRCANDPDHRLEVIRRLRDTIAKGESE